MAAIGCCQATKKTRREASLAMSVEGIEPSTNGLKGQSPENALPNQWPALFAQSTGQINTKYIG
jgi:hypothetical protein